MASPTTKASVSECSIVPNDEPQRLWLVLLPPWEFPKKKATRIQNEDDSPSYGMLDQIFTVTERFTKVVAGVWPND